MDGNAIDLPPHAAALLAKSADRWVPVEVWPYPERPAHARWTAVVADAPLCTRRGP
jgi:hypothetical protein